MIWVNLYLVSRLMALNCLYNLIYGEGIDSPHIICFLFGNCQEENCIFSVHQN